MTAAPSGHDTPSPPSSPSVSSESSQQPLSEAIMASFSRLEIAHARQQADLTTQFNEAFNHMGSQEDIIATQSQRIDEQNDIIATQGRRIEAQAGAATRLADGNNSLHRLVFRMLDELELLVLRRRKLDKANDFEDVAKIVSKYREEADGIGKKASDPSRNSQSFVPSPFVASIATAFLAHASTPAKTQLAAGSGNSVQKLSNQEGPSTVSQAGKSDRSNTHSKAPAASSGKANFASRATHRVLVEKKFAPDSGAQSPKPNTRTPKGQ